MKHPIQPISLDNSGILRFKKNEIVCFLLDNGPFDLNDLARRDFNSNDREQFAQLIGYSSSGFCSLSYVSDETVDQVEEMEEECRRIEEQNHKDKLEMMKKFHIKDKEEKEIHQASPEMKLFFEKLLSLKSLVERQAKTTCLGNSVTYLDGLFADIYQKLDEIIKEKK